MQFCLQCSAGIEPDLAVGRSGRVCARSVSRIRSPHWTGLGRWPVWPSLWSVGLPYHQQKVNRGSGYTRCLPVLLIHMIHLPGSRSRSFSLVQTRTRLDRSGPHDPSVATRWSTPVACYVNAPVDTCHVYANDLVHARINLRSDL